MGNTTLAKKNQINCGPEWRQNQICTGFKTEIKGNPGQQSTVAWGLQEGLGVLKAQVSELELTLH